MGSSLNKLKQGADIANKTADTTKKAAETGKTISDAVRGPKDSKNDTD